MASRQNTFRMKAAEITRYRSAIQMIMNISSQNAGDERGYNYFSGIHGLPLPIHCTHGSILFFPWHRAYLYFFELALQEASEDDQVFIPWWDWLSDDAHMDGIPGFFTDEVTDNPLARADVHLSLQDISLIRSHPRLENTLDFSDPQQPRTHRFPGSPRGLPYRMPPTFVGPTSASEDWFNVENILDDENFNSFSTRLENIHGGIHGWVSGSMSQVPTAAFDPVFFSHHSMIDNLWSVWQDRHGKSGPDEQLWNTVLTPFPVTVQDMLSIEQLNYDYVETATIL